MSALRSRVDRLDGGTRKPLDRMSDGELWRIVRRGCSPAQLAIIENGSPQKSTRSCSRSLIARTTRPVSTKRAGLVVPLKALHQAWPHGNGHCSAPARRAP